MGINSFPAALVPLIQTGFLERTFDDAMKSKLGYRSIARRETFPNGIGETLTKTRTGWLSPVTTPANPASNTNLDNGITPDSWALEQFTMSINQYQKGMDLNVVTQKVGLKEQFVKNSAALGYNAAQSLDDLARNALFTAYMGGNTRVNTTLGSNGTVVSVDDISGFQQVFDATNSAYVTVSSSKPLSVTINGVANTVTLATADGSNVSTAPLGISGTLTFGSTVTVANGTVGNAVIAASGSTIIRPNARSTTAAITAGDVFTGDMLLDAVAQLRNNCVPEIDGMYHCFLSPTSERQLLSDPNVRQLFQGRGTNNSEFGNAYLGDAYGVRFFRTTEVQLQAAPGVTGAKIHRPIVCGAGALIEGDFQGMGSSETAPSDSLIYMIDDVVHVIREPLDRLQQIIAQSWYWIGGFVAPSDTTTNATIVPTASAARFKRSVIIEHIG
jgi:N4-gp56 family major capsid protein